EYGKKPYSQGPDPLTELILTVLSQNTSDINRNRAFKSLKEHFPTWEDVLNTSPAKLSSAISIGGLAKIKSWRIIKLLKSIQKSHGRLDLDFLHNWPDKKVKDYLLGIDGIGPKTAACVLVFSLGRNVMPVDTHVYRVSKRLGIIPGNTTAEAAHDFFIRFDGTVSLYQFHLNIIEHGRKICQARKPRCNECSLKRLCRYYKNTGNTRSNTN
ncbi:MAG: endonuclease III, partial [Candidatus Zixiibacteriota bacterium]